MMMVVKNVFAFKIVTVIVMRVVMRMIMVIKRVMIVAEAVVRLKVRDSVKLMRMIVNVVMRVTLLRW